MNFHHLPMRIASCHLGNVEPVLSMMSVLLSSLTQFHLEFLECYFSYQSMNHKTRPLNSLLILNVKFCHDYSLDEMLFVRMIKVLIQLSSLQICQKLLKKVKLTIQARAFSNFLAQIDKRTNIDKFKFLLLNFLVLQRTRESCHFVSRFHRDHIEDKSN
jgi:hypothetical protein